jgi:ring-1,2-phenylacetyl-CoA epoxidase subunit PaaD
MLTQTEAWSALEQIPDPEIPVVSVCELGIVREVRIEADAATVVITPTYSGCPATEMIEASIRQALLEAGWRNVHVERRLAPAWSTDWIAPAAAAKLRDYGIAPPHATGPREAQVVRFTAPTPACPRCGSARTQRLSEFGSTACKALYRCNACSEPFDYFKPI